MTVESELTQRDCLVTRIFDGRYVPPKTIEREKRECPFYYFLERVRAGFENDCMLEPAEFVLQGGHLEERKNGLGKMEPLVSGEVLEFADLSFEVFISAEPLSAKQVAFLEKAGFVYVFGPGPEYRLMKSTFTGEDFGKNGQKPE